MKRFGFVVLALVILSTFTMSGCGSAQKKLSEDVKGVKTKVDTLETRVDSVETKQSEADRLVMEQGQRMENLRAEKITRRAPKRTNVGIKTKNSHKNKEQLREIQTCLKNAGFYKGKIDGIKGRRTRSAIKKFQRANGLKADGIVGKRTWEVLSRYISGGSGSATGGTEEEAGTK